MPSLHTIFQLAARDLPAVGVECLLIGGFAVNFHGYTRNTLDVDFMIVAEQLHAVRQIMTRAGFTNVLIKDQAAYFSAPDSPLRVDFLRVAPATMQRLLQHAQPATIQGQSVKVPALPDLLAMKIFALAQDPGRRQGKDLPDIAYLSVLHDLDWTAELQPLCQRYGSPETTRLIQAHFESLRA